MEYMQFSDAQTLADFVRKTMEEKGLSSYDVQRRGGIDGTFTPYSLRHTCASLMALSGVHVKAASEKLGHSNIQTTLAIYTHVLVGMQEDAVDKLADMLY